MGDTAHAGSGTTGSPTTMVVAHTRVASVAFDVEGHDHAAAGAPAADVFTFSPLEDTTTPAHPDGFGRAPASVACAIFAQTPSATGGTPVVSLTASATTATEASFKWKFDPKDAKQQPIASLSHVWMRITVDSAPPFIFQAGLASRGIHDLKWSVPHAVRPGSSVTIAADLVGFGASPQATVKVYDASKIGPDGTIPDDAKVLDTLTATVSKKGKVTAPWASVKLPDPPASSSGSGPQPLPAVVFVVAVDGTSAISPSLGVVPDIRLTFKAGDPNWLMERICAPAQGHEDRVDRDGSEMGQFGSDPSAQGAPPDDSRRFPKRVLGLKQRLQALGYYYEKLAPPLPAAASGTTTAAPASRTPPAGSTAPPARSAAAGSSGASGAAATPPPPRDPNKQTRVFRKCLRWYWKNVFPKDGSDAPMTSGDLDPNEVPPLGPQIVDVYHARMTDLCRDLEDRVRKQVVMQDPDAAGSQGGGSQGGGSQGGSSSDVDLTKETRLVFPGDFHTNNQEVLVHLQNPGAAPTAQLFNLTTKPEDYTYRRPLGPSDDHDYANHVGGLSGAKQLPDWAFQQIAALGDFRFLEERLTFALNPALGKVPLVAKLEMQTRAGDDKSWVEGPADGIRVIFQLAAVPETSAHEPPYLDRLQLRKTTQVTSPRGALPTLPASQRPAPAPGPRGYLAGVHSAMHKLPAPDDDVDPTWWNAPTLFGGKRSPGPPARKVNAAGPASSGAILLTGADAAALGVPDGHDFPWSSEDATSAKPAHSARHRRAVSVAVHRGQAVLILSPSRLAGDCYRVKAWAEVLPAAPNGTPEVLGEKTTETMTVWRRIRVTRYFKKAYPADWTDSAGESPKKQAGGDIGDIDWKNVAALYKKAFFILEAPEKTTPLDCPLRDKAVRGALKLVDSVVRSNATAEIDWGLLLRRETLGDVPNPFPKYDPLTLVPPQGKGKDSPYIIDWNPAAAYDALQPAGAPRAGSFPYNQYYHLIARIEDLVLAYTGMFLDDEYDPDHHDSYDGVPSPGVTCVQALRADAYTLTGAGEYAAHIDAFNLEASPGAASAPPFLGSYAAATGATALSKLRNAFLRKNARRYSVKLTYRNELGHKIEAPVPVTNAATFTIDDALAAFRGATALTHHSDYGTDAPLLSMTLSSDSRIVVELRPTTQAGTHTPSLQFSGESLDPNFSFEADKSDPTKVRFTTGRLWDASNLTPVNYDATNPAKPGTLDHDLASLNIMSTAPALKSGDRIVIRRARLVDDWTAQAKLPAVPEPPAPGQRAPADTALQGYKVPVWRQIEFIYGSGTPSSAASASASGTKLKELNDFIRANVATGLLGSRTDVVYELKRAGANGAPDQFFSFRVEEPMRARWVRDALNLEFLVVRPGSGSTSDDEQTYFPVILDTVMADIADASKGSVTTEGASGLACHTRTFYLFYGDDEYNNAGFWGADPSGKNGRGYASPGNLDMMYTLWVNAAHELGHMLYLRHQWTGVGSSRGNGWNYIARGDENPTDHDDDDLCHMGYFTSYLETSGDERARGRAELCGRCILKLRGWTPLPANAPTSRPHGPPRPARGPAPPLPPPAAGRTRILDWWPAPVPTPRGAATT